jgi:hypothetical protein
MMGSAFAVGGEQWLSAIRYDTLHLHRSRWMLVMKRFAAGDRGSLPNQGEKGMNAMSPVMPTGVGIFGGLFFLIWLLMMGGAIIGYIVLILAVWRGMKAHESIALSLERIAEK